MKGGADWSMQIRKRVGGRVLKEGHKSVVVCINIWILPVLLVLLIYREEVMVWTVWFVV